MHVLCSRKIFAGSYADGLYQSWVLFTWRLARYVYRLRVFGDALLLQAHGVLARYPPSNSLPVCVAVLVTFLLGPVMYCMASKRRRQCS